MREIVLVKLGGSLITDKRRPETSRPEVLERLGRELDELSRSNPGGLLVGHGSGSFGHAAAARHALGGRLTSPEQWDGVVRTQEAALGLHRLVMSSLRGAGAPAFSFAPSSFVTAAAGAPGEPELGPMLHALDNGLLPVVYGDVVMDLDWGASILSTESLFVALARQLLLAGRPIRRAIWLGITAGVLDPAGETLRRVSPRTAGEALQSAGDAAGTDVTGGMRHRLESALELSQLGIASWIVDGRQPGMIARILRGENAGGTVVEAER